jgi:aminoglycoside phosphotransferase (APT) family kinase protein
MSIYAVLTPAAACRALREAGFAHRAEALRIDAREERWAVSLPDGRIAWFPGSEAGAMRLAVERRVLGLLSRRCSVPVPESLFVSNSGFDVRRMVPGRYDPWGLYRRCQADRQLAQKIRRAIGQILVEQHTRIVEADAVGWLRQHVPWPETGAWIGERLPRVIDDRGLIRSLADVIEEYEGVAVNPADRALVHGDLGLHNLALDQADAVNGVFDYDGAAWADRHHDFRYLLFDVERDDMLDAALRIYEPAVTRSLDRNRIRLYNLDRTLARFRYLRNR